MCARTTRGLIKKKDRGVREELRGDVEALALAAREPLAAEEGAAADLRPGGLGQVNLLDHLGGWEGGGGDGVSGRDVCGVLVVRGGGVCVSVFGCVCWKVCICAGACVCRPVCMCRRVCV